MVALLNATLLKPINRILEERDKSTKGRFAEAESALRSVDEKLAGYEARLREARAEGYVLLEEERARAARERELQVAQVKAEVAGSLLGQKQKLGAEVDEIRRTLAGDARAMAARIARQILRRDVSDARQ
jgi:F-type H+-transporting ATPase subunit b